MKALPLAIISAFIMVLSSCASLSKTAIAEEAIPADIKKYKVLYTEINFENTVTNSTANIHNNAAKKHVIKKTGNPDVFINETDLTNGKFTDLDVYRYVLLNRITKKLTKTYYRANMSTGARSNDGQSVSYITEFYFVDRKTGKEYQHITGTTMPLYMLKAVVDKVTAG